MCILVPLSHLFACHLCIAHWQVISDGFPALATAPKPTASAQALLLVWCHMHRYRTATSQRGQSNLMPYISGCPLLLSSALSYPKASPGLKQQGRCSVTVADGPCYVRAHLTKFPHHTQQAFMPCLVYDCTSYGARHPLASSHHHQHVVHCSIWCFGNSCFGGDFSPKSVQVLGG